MLPFGKTGKSQLATLLVKKKKICLHLVLICSPAEKPKTTFYGCGQTASSFRHGMIKRSASPRPRLCLSLSTCSIIINSETGHIPFVQRECHRWWPSGGSFCRWGPKSCRAPHTFSRSFALLPCLTAAVTILPVRLGLDAGNFEERFVGVTLSAPRWERIMGHLKHCSVSTRTRLSSSFLSGIFANLKISVEKTTGRDPFKSLISSPWEASFPGEAAMANWGDSKSFWKGEIDLFSLCYWAWKIFTSPICPSAEGLWHDRVLRTWYRAISWQAIYKYGLLKVAVK